MPEFTWQALLVGVVLARLYRRTDESRGVIAADRQTGSTLAANQLREVAQVLDSEAVVIQTRAPLCRFKHDWVNRILKRLDGVLQVRESKYIMLHAPRSALKAITATKRRR